MTAYAFSFTTLDGARQWIGNEGSLHYAVGNATGLGASIAGRYASIYKARTGKDISVRGTEEEVTRLPSFGQGPFPVVAVAGLGAGSP